ncbi:MAG: YceI family protein [Desulfobulbaceae bacterium]|nr:YceI family protein [Desulfobulbaceae bacterium]
MKRYLTAALLFIMALVPAVTALAAEWRIDNDHSSAYFSIQHLTVSKVHGTFKTIAGTLSTDDKTGAVTGLNFTIEVKSIDTGVVKRDDDLKSPNFFEVAKFPNMTFVAKGIADQGDGTLMVTGDLTIHGKTNPIKVTMFGPSPEIKDPWGMTRRGLHLETKLNRQDYGMNYNKVLDNGGLLIGDLVSAEADIEVIRTPAK